LPIKNTAGYVSIVYRVAMKLYGLYLEAEIPAPTETPGAAPEAPDLADKSRSEAAKKEADAITIDLRRSLRGVVESLSRLPVMDVRSEARDATEMMMKSLTGFAESFEEDGANFDAILSAIMAGGK
jgi:hypothetical protein